MTQVHGDKAVNSASIDSQRWQAVCDRDGARDGTFVFAVSTTGIYCRPSCTSRRAKRENVMFYDTPAQAETAGFRPCKRCTPDQIAHQLHLQAIVQACHDIESAEEEPDLATLAARAGLSPSHFQRIFKAQVGLSPKRYAVAVRKRRLRDELAQAETVTHAIYDAGYASASRAYADGAAPGMAPDRYRRGAAGESISYASAKTSLGEILVAATERGICMVEFGSRQETETALQERFPQARLAPANDDLADWVVRVVTRIDRPNNTRGDAAPLPLDIRGTAFQEKVWRALTEIPPGETVSYGQLAQSLGQPKAARAVAGACATNHLAVVVPCHRVIRGSGNLAGYKWGIERKRALLEREARIGTSTETRL